MLLDLSPGLGVGLGLLVMILEILVSRRVFSGKWLAGVLEITATHQSKLALGSPSLWVDGWVMGSPQQH